MRFNSNGEFKIVQFTDLHFNAHLKQSNIALKRMDEVVKSEKPDLIVVTGDIVYSRPAEDALTKVIERISGYGIPFCTVYGNHDDERGLSKNQLSAIIHRYPWNLLPSDKNEDYQVKVLSSTSDSTAAVLYMIDSNANVYRDGKWMGYDAIHPEQVEWYKRVSAANTLENGGTPLPAVMFFHIPLPEMKEASQSDETVLVGTRMEKVSCPKFNTGMFAAIKECGDVMATFVGHDHDNDYVTMWDGILLGYGRFTGGNTEYNDIPNGARVIVLKEGKREFDTWCVLKGGVVINKITYPTSLISTPWRDRPLDPECEE